MKKNILTIVLSVTITLLFIIFIAQPAIVSGSSMHPTFEDGNFVLMEKITKDYKRYDVVIFKTNGMFVIKRVLGLPGETVQIIDNDIYINDEKIDDYVNIKIKDYGMAAEKITLKENQYFLLGDNRNDSLDSRFEEIGLIERAKIKGRVVLCFLPFKTANNF